jgi:integration host factor subunit alpha
MTQEHIDDLTNKKKTLSRSRLVTRLEERGLGKNKHELRQYVDSVIDIICERLEDGEEVKISGFGNLKPKDKMARVGRNPQTDEPLIISRRRNISFQASKKLLNAINHSTKS